MKIGTWWGMPAPMMALAGVNPSFVKKASYNDYTKRCVRAEMLMLIQALQNSEIDGLGPLLEGVKGKTVQEVVQSDGERMLVLGVVDAVATRLRRGRKFSLGSNDEAIRKSINEQIQITLNATGNTIEFKRFVQQVVKGLASNSGSTNLLQIAHAFNLTLKAPTTVRVENEERTLSEEASLIWNKILGQSELLLAFTGQGELTTNADVLVFGNDATDLLLRKPTSLLYIVLNKFNYVKGKNNATVLQGVINNTQENINKYRNFIETRVKTDDVLQEQVLMSSNVFTRDYAESPIYFKLSKLVPSDKLSDFTKDQFDDLAKICIFTDRVKAEVQTIWSEKLSAELRSYGIVGVNNLQDVLFKEFLDNQIFSCSNDYTKTAEEIKEITLVMDEIQALLDTLIPIGKEI